MKWFKKSKIPGKKLWQQEDFLPRFLKRRQVFKRIPSKLGGVRLRTGGLAGGYQPALVGKGLLLLSLSLLTYLVFFSESIYLTGWQAVGNHLVSDKEIEAVLFKDGFKAVNLFFVPEARLRRKLKNELLQIKEVKFRKNFWRKELILVIEEHGTSIVWQTNNQRFLINYEGIIYDQAPAEIPLVIVEDLKNVPVELGQRIVTREFVEFVTSVVANLPRKTNLTVERVVVPETTFEIEVYTSSSLKLIFDTTRPVDIQLGNLAQVLKQVGERPLQYVDLRIEDRVYYK